MTAAVLIVFFIFPLSLSPRDLVAPLVDSPAKTIGSDFNGDGIHDIAMSADLNNDGASDAGAVYILYGVGQFSSTYRLDGAGVNVTIVGKAASDFLGRDMKSAGDVNSDGFDDLIMGALGNNDGPGANNAGAAYILYGSPNLSANYEINGTGVNITILGKAASDSLGSGVSGAGDVNGDGFDDLIVGAYKNGDGASLGGAAYILYGSASLSADYRIDGAGVSVTILGKGASDALGSEGVSSAGDVNADGFDDVIIGAYSNDDGVSDGGAAYVLFGSSSLSATIQLAGAGANVTLLGAGSSDQFGLGAAGIGDLNGDGFHDFWAGATLNDNGGTNAGAAYIIYGRTFETGRTIPIASEGPNVSIVGVATAQDRLGRVIAAAGDINDDGFHDIVTGAGDVGTADNEGAGYIIYGSTSLASQINAGNNDVTITGKAAGDAMGHSSSGLGDVNNDGFPDVAVSAMYNNYGAAVDTGAVYIIFGGESITSNLLVAGSGPNVTIVGKAASDRLGRFVGGGRWWSGP